MFTRRPWIYWTFVVVGAALVAAAAHSNLDGVRRERDAWGATATVWIATRDIAPGQSMVGQSTSRSVPVAMTPPGAVTLDDLEGADGSGVVARQRISVGEIITGVDLSVADSALALVPLGWVAVAITESPRSGASEGSRVQLVADGVVIAADGLVIGDVDGATLVAVPEDVAPLVPVAAQSGTLTLLRVP